MIDVALDARFTPRMSVGVRAYVRALIDGLPRVAPDIRLHAVGRGLNFGLDEQLRLPAEIDRLARTTRRSSRRCAVAGRTWRWCTI